MTDFSKIIDKAKELELKMKESQEKIKNIRAEGISGNNSVKVTLDGEGEMQNPRIFTKRSEVDREMPKLDEKMQS